MMCQSLLNKIIELKLIAEYYAETTRHRHTLQNLSLNQVFVKSLLPQVVERLSVLSLNVHLYQNQQQRSQQSNQGLIRNENRLE